MSILTDLIDELERAPDKFNASTPAIQRQVFDRIAILLKELDTIGTNLKTSVTNLRKIGKIKREIERIVLTDKYIKDVGIFTNSFQRVTELQTAYFASLEQGFTVPAIVKELQRTAIISVQEGLLEQGISQEIAQKSADIIRLNITENASFGDLVGEMRDFIAGDKNTDGALQRHAKQLTTDAINTYSAEYNQIVSDDLGFEWYRYVGALVKRSRDFCIALHKKDFIHKSEFASITRGQIDINHDGTPETVSLAGLKPDTNASNFIIKRGGWQCAHHVTPVLTASVPKKLQDKFN